MVGFADFDALVLRVSCGCACLANVQLGVARVMDEQPSKPWVRERELCALPWHVHSGNSSLPSYSGGGELRRMTYGLERRMTMGWNAE